MSTPHADYTQYGPEFIGAVELLRRTGMTGIQLRYQDELDPVVWIVVAEHTVDGEKRFTPACALHPVKAMYMVCEVLIDGGECTQCNKPTTFIPPHEKPLDEMFRVPLCFIEWDPESEQFERRH